MGLKDSVWGALGLRASPAPREACLKIRNAMLAALGQHGPDNYYALDLKITFAKEVDELWGLRPELLAALAAKHGESEARQSLDAITQMFEGHHSGASKSWFGSLNP